MTETDPVPKTDPTPGSVEPRIVQILAEALAEAQEGKIQGLALAAVAANGQFRTVFFGASWMSTLVGVVSNMQHRMNQAMWVTDSKQQTPNRGGTAGG